MYLKADLLIALKYLQATKTPLILKFTSQVKVSESLHYFTMHLEKQLLQPKVIMLFGDWIEILLIILLKMHRLKKEKNMIISYNQLVF
jgi:hypothetical protein